MRPIQVNHIHLAAPIKERTLALVTDLHRRAPQEVAEILLDEAPDAVLIAGDLFETPPRRRRSDCDAGLALLRRLAHKFPIFYCPGNHDARLPANVAQEMGHLGVRILEDNYLSWEGIYIGGLTSARFVKGRIPRLDFLNQFDQQDGYKLLLSHHPEYFPRYIRPLSIDLTVSGHAHGGQWCFFGRGIFSPGQGLFPRYTHGVHHAGRLVVSRGVGDSNYIPRIGAPHEIVMLHLSRNPQGEE